MGLIFNGLQTIRMLLVNNHLLQTEKNTMRICFREGPGMARDVEEV